MALQAQSNSNLSTTSFNHFDQFPRFQQARQKLSNSRHSKVLITVFTHVHSFTHSSIHRSVDRSINQPGLRSFVQCWAARTISLGPTRLDRIGSRRRRQTSSPGGHPTYMSFINATAVWNFAQRKHPQKVINLRSCRRSFGESLPKERDTFARRVGNIVDSKSGRTLLTNCRLAPSTGRAESSGQAARSSELAFVVSFSGASSVSLSLVATAASPPATAAALARAREAAAGEKTWRTKQRGMDFGSAICGRCPNP